MCIACVPRTIASRSLVALDIETIDDVDRVVGLSGIGLGGVSAAEATSRRPAGRPGLSPREGQTLIAVALEHVRAGKSKRIAPQHTSTCSHGLRRGELLFQCKRAMAVVTSTCHMSFSFARRSVSCACFSRMACFSSMAWSVPRFPSKSACKAAQSMAGVLVVMPGRSFTST